jgi:hypothetical protein
MSIRAGEATRALMTLKQNRNLHRDFPSLLTPFNGRTDIMYEFAFKPTDSDMVERWRMLPVVDGVAMCEGWPQTVDVDIDKNEQKTQVVLTLHTACFIADFWDAVRTRSGGEFVLKEVEDVNISTLLENTRAYGYFPLGAGWFDHFLSNTLYETRAALKRAVAELKTLLERYEAEYFARQMATLGQVAVASAVGGAGLLMMYFTTILCRGPTKEIHYHEPSTTDTSSQETKNNLDRGCAKAAVQVTQTKEQPHTQQTRTQINRLGNTFKPTVATPKRAKKAHQKGQEIE